MIKEIFGTENPTWDDVEELFSNSGFDFKKIIEKTTKWSKTAQRNIFLFALWIIRVYGSEEYRQDLHKKTARQASKILESGLLN